MNKLNKLICLGGTGQMVLHYYLQLYLIGAIEKPFDAVVIDTDDIIPSLQEMRRFLQLITPNGEELPRIGVIQLTQRGGAASAFQLMTGVDREQAGGLVPAQAFFNSGTLEQDLTNGLFARPALSSVVAIEEIDERIVVPEPDSNVVVVGSVIGGTGGGLIEPVINLIRHFLDVNTINAHLKAVLFGQYFEPDPGRIELRRLQSNQLLVLRTAKEALSELQSFKIIGGPGERNMIQKMPDKNERNIVWPDDDAHPFWQGVQAVHYLLEDSTTDKKTDFLQREVTQISNPLELNRCRERLTNALLVLETLRKRDVIARVEREPMLGFIWGEGLTRVVSHFWRIGAKIAGEWERVATFPVKVQHEVEALWSGEAGSSGNRGLGSVFPSITARHKVRPRSFRAVPWRNHERRADFDRSLFDSADAAVLRCAADVTFAAIQRGN